MGTPMALNLIKTGHNVSVYNRTQSKTEIFSEQGYSVYHTLRQIIENCDIVFGKGYKNKSILPVSKIIFYSPYGSLVMVRTLTAYLKIQRRGPPVRDMPRHKVIKILTLTTEPVQSFI